MIRNKIINISKIRFNQLYGKFYQEFNLTYTSDNSIGYFSMLESARKIYNKHPYLATRLINVVENTMNDKHSRNADKSSTNKLIAYCVKTGNVDLLQQRYFAPNTLSLVIYPSFFKVLRDCAYYPNQCDWYDSLMTLDSNDKGVLFFQNFIKSVNRIIVDYLFKLGYIDKDYIPTMKGTLAFSQIPYFNKFFNYDYPISMNKYIGFNIFFNAYFSTKKPHTMFYDVMIRYLMISLYVEQYDNYVGNYFKIFESKPKLPRLLQYIKNNYSAPKIKVLPYYLEMFKQLKMFQHRMNKKYHYDNC